MRFNLWASVALLVTAFASGGVCAQPAAKLDAAQSEIVFVSRQMGVSVEGKFRKFDAQITLDPKKPEAGSVALTIDTGSATLGLPETDAELVKPNWFDAAKAPQASFRSNAIKSLGAGKYEVSGTLSIKGNAQKLTVPVSVTQAGGTSTASGSFAIKRLDYKIGEGEWADTSLVANEVQVKFKLALTGIPPL
jgi:polyisoprenoid-binding protein YceI